MFRRFVDKSVILFLFVFVPLVPCLCQDTIRIMPIGNSITDGWTNGSLPLDQMRSYRYGLKFLLNSHGYKTDFVGSQSSGCSFFSDCQHAGFGGTQDQYILRLLTDGLITYYTTEWVTMQTIQPPGPYLDVFNPDIILLHIGTNDITHEGSAALANQKITAILDKVDEYEARANKDVIVFVALILNRCTYSSLTSAFNNGIKTLVQNRINSGDKLVIVDMEHDAGIKYMDDADMADNLHPNELGYNKMASLWCSSIEANYNTAPVITNIPDQIFDEGGSSNAILLDDYVSDLQDPDENITWTAVQLGSTNLNITINSNRQAVATPKDMEWSGSQTVVFKATDLGKNGKYIKFDSDTIVFTVNAVEKNSAPVIIQIPDQAFDEGTSSDAIALDDYVSDLQDSDEEILWTAIQLETTFLDISITSNRQIIATPKDLEWNGSQTVVLTATDKGLNGCDIKSASDTMVFTVIAVNDPPIITSTPDTTAIVGNSYNYTLTCDDIDNTSVILSAVIKPAWLNFSASTGLLTGIPNASYLGNNKVVLRCSDGLLATDQEFFIHVSNYDAINEKEKVIFYIYPVPAHKFLMIATDHIIEQTTVEIIDISGTLCRRLTLFGMESKYQLDLEGFEDGVYYLRLTNDSQTYISKFILIN